MPIFLSRRYAPVFEVEAFFVEALCPPVNDVAPRNGAAMKRIPLVTFGMGRGTGLAAGLLVWRDFGVCCNNLI